VSARKTAVVEAVKAPLESAQTKLRADAIEQGIGAKLDLEVAKQYAEDMTKAANTAKLAALNNVDPETQVELDAAAETAREDMIKAARLLREAQQRLPITPTLVRGGDATPEALAKDLAAAGERMAIFDDEGQFFEVVAGLYNSGKPNTDLILKSYTESAKDVSRVGDGHLRLERPALTLGLAVQPDVIEKAMQQPQFVRRGLMARFVVVYAAARAGAVTGPPVDALVTAAYRTSIVELATELPRRVAERDGEPFALRFTAEAQEVFMAEANEMHSRTLSTEDAGLCGWLGKRPGWVARVSALIHFMTHGPDGVDKPIGVEAVEAAFRYAEAVTPHAARAFRAVADGDLALAEKFLDKLALLVRETGQRRHKLHQVSRGIYSVTTDALAPALALLVRLNWIAVEEIKPKNGGHPARWVILHPDAETVER
jgi:replicative DNA helicase